MCEQMTKPFRTTCPPGVRHTSRGQYQPRSGLAVSPLPCFSQSLKYIEPSSSAGTSDIVARFGSLNTLDLYFLPPWSETVVSAGLEEQLPIPGSPERCICQCPCQYTMTANISLVQHTINSRRPSGLGPLAATETLGILFANSISPLSVCRRRRPMAWLPPRDKT